MCLKYISYFIQKNIASLLFFYLFLIENRLLFTDFLTEYEPQK
jgi:hypothetical protein